MSARKLDAHGSPVNEPTATLVDCRSGAVHAYVRGTGVMGGLPDRIASTLASAS